MTMSNEIPELAGYEPHRREWVPLDQVNSLKFYNPVDSPALIRMAQGHKD